MIIKNLKILSLLVLLPASPCTYSMEWKPADRFAQNFSNNNDVKIISGILFLEAIIMNLINKNYDGFKTCGSMYLLDKAITLSHELGHGVTAHLLGLPWKAIYLSPWFLGGGCVDIPQEMPFLKSLLDYGAGPITGALVAGGLSYYFYKKKGLEKDKKISLVSFCIFETLNNLGNLIPYNDSDGWHIVYNYKNH